MGSQNRLFAVDEDLQTLMQVAEGASLLAVPQYIEANEEGDIIEVVEED